MTSQRPLSRWILLWIPLMFLPSAGGASSGTEGAAFLNIPVGARPAALGSGYSALATDAYAPVWNPAGLGFLESTQLAAQHLSYLETLNHEYLGFVSPVGHQGAWGVSAQYLGSGDIPETDVSGNTLGNYTSHWGSYNLAYGRPINDHVAFGATFKWIDAKIADVRAQAYALDVGSLVRLRPDLTLAATLTNLGNRLQFIHEGDSLPLAGHLGAAYQIHSRVGLNAEVVFPKTGEISGHAGVEWQPLPMIALRAGYRSDTVKELSALAGLSLGAGVMVMGQELAYAWLPYGDLGSTQYFSIVFRFGESSKNKILTQPM